jgi:hypothetical protein
MRSFPVAARHGRTPPRVAPPPARTRADSASDEGAPCHNDRNQWITGHFSWRSTYPRRRGRRSPRSSGSDLLVMGSMMFRGGPETCPQCGGNETVRDADDCVYCYACEETLPLRAPESWFVSGAYCRLIRHDPRAVKRRMTALGPEAWSNPSSFLLPRGKTNEGTRPPWERSAGWGAAEHARSGPGPSHRRESHS